MHLLGYSVQPLLLLLCLLYPFVLVSATRHPLILTVLGWIAIFNVLVPVPGILVVAGQRRLGRGWVRALPRIVMLTVLGAGMMVNTARAAWQAVRATPATFERTPKFGDGREVTDWRRLRYQVAIDRIVLVEIALAAFECATAVAAVRVGSWSIALYAGVFATGLLFVAALTIGQTVGAAMAVRRAGMPARLPRRVELVDAAPPIVAPGRDPRGA